MQPRFVARSLLAVALGLAVVLGMGLAASSCGPKQKFCPDAGDGVCRPPPDAAVDMGVDAPDEAACPNGIMIAGDGATVCNP
jgi:hypothetical protein